MRQLFFLLFIVLLAACAGGAKTETAREGAIFELSSDVLANRADTLVDLGRLKEGEVVRYDAKIRNVGTEPLVLTDVTSSCGCTAVDYEKQPIQSGAEGALSFRFDSRGMWGTQLKLVEVGTSAGKYRITVRAEVN